MDDKLTKQDKIFVKEIVEHGNQTEAAKKAYDIENDDYARLKGHRQITKDNIKNAVQSIADRIPDDKLHEVLMEGLKAENNERPDYGIRHKYLDTALKIKGAYETDENKNINILMPVLVKFLDKKDDETSDNRNTE